MRHLFHNHRRVKRRHLRDAALGNPTTISAAIVWLVAFATLWLVIIRGVEEYDPQRWVNNLVETSNYAIEHLETYRSENGSVPDGLECFGFDYTGYRNTYYIQLPRHGYGYSIEDVKTSDTTYRITFGSEHYISGEWLPSERLWRVVTHYDDDTTMVASF